MTASFYEDIHVTGMYVHVGLYAPIRGPYSNVYTHAYELKFIALGIQDDTIGTGRQNKLDT